MIGDMVLEVRVCLWFALLKLGWFIDGFLVGIVVVERNGLV